MQMKKGFQLITLLILAIFPFSGAPAAPQSPWQAKVDAWVLDSSAAGETEFLVFLKTQADLSGAVRATVKEEKGAYVYRQLAETARRTQGPLLAELQRLGLEYRPYWVANLVWVRGDRGAVQALAQRADVAHLFANPKVRAEEPMDSAAPESTQAVEWNIEQVGAPQVWAAGVTGQGVTIGGQDTGYDWDHPALRDKYRGWDGNSADHHYNWHDAIHEDNANSSGENTCGFDSPAPCDDGGHGTHTMGTMVGSRSASPGDNGPDQIGMAPGARWIGCRNMENGWGTPATYIECFQWFIAPTDLNGENPDPSKAPHVINNSWSCPQEEGCTDPTVLKSVVEAVRAAGILSVQSAGNEGPACSTVFDPAAIYDATFSVGATDSGDNIASFSSRGPVTADGSNRLKPDVSAPGVGIRSSLPGSGYGSLSGTSMAGPHVAGLAALLISANPDLAGNVDELESLITGNAVPRQVQVDCGGTGGQIPNNVYGWGRIDAWAAFQEARQEFHVSFTPDRSGSTGPGKSIRYTHTLTNTGLQADTYQLSFESSLGWSVTLTSSLTLQPGEAVVVRVTLTTPQDSPIGAVDSTRLTAVSQGDPQVSAEVTDTTIVLYQQYLTGILK
jgi:subtilisin family serine protease